MTPTPSIIRRSAAEALGTFLLVFVGSGAAAVGAFHFPTTPVVGVLFAALGLGLGLHICRTIIERHQGQVGVQSAPGQGSTFWFTLPLGGEPDEGGPAPE